MSDGVFAKVPTMTDETLGGALGKLLMSIGRAAAPEMENMLRLQMGGDFVAVMDAGSAGALRVCVSFDPMTVEQMAAWRREQEMKRS